jgi:hypothetical protein
MRSHRLSWYTRRLSFQVDDFVEIGGVQIEVRVRRQSVDQRTSLLAGQPMEDFACQHDRGRWLLCYLAHAWLKSS